MLNSVSYRDAGALAPRSSELARAYEEAGVARLDRLGARGRPRGGRRCSSGAGHVLDGRRRRWSSSSPTSPPRTLGDLDWDADARPRTSARINDLAYGLRASGRSAAPLTRARRRAAAPLPGARRRQPGVRARDGRPRATTAASTSSPLRSTAAAASPAGCSHAALAEARERGLRDLHAAGDRSSATRSTSALGYEPICAIEM